MPFGYTNKSSNELSEYFKKREYSDKEVWILGINDLSENDPKDHL